MGDEQTEAKLAHLQAIYDKEVEVGRLEDDFEAKNERAKAAKKVFDAADTELRQLIRDRNQKRFDFDASESEPWRDVALEDLAISATYLTALYEGGLETIGELTDWQAVGEGRELTELKGMGPVGAAEVADHLATFWKEHPEYCTEVAEPAEEKENSEEAEVHPEAI